MQNDKATCEKCPLKINKPEVKWPLVVATVRSPVKNSHRQQRAPARCISGDGKLHTYLEDVHEVGLLALGGGKVQENCIDPRRVAHPQHLHTHSLLLDCCTARDAVPTHFIGEMSLELKLAPSPPADVWQNSAGGDEREIEFGSRWFFDLARNVEGEFCANIRQV